MDRPPEPLAGGILNGRIGGQAAGRMVSNRRNQQTVRFQLAKMR